MPPWLLPSILCILAATGAVRLKLHFDELLDDVAAANPPSSGQSLATASVDTDTDSPIGPDVLALLPGGASLPRAGATNGLPAKSDDADTDGEATGGAAGADPSAAPSGAAELAPLETGGLLWVDPASSQRAWSDLGAVEGLLTFRGNPTRTWYGRGPVPSDPEVLWSIPVGCSNSPDGGNEPKVWCGSGWTGQPVIFRPGATNGGIGGIGGDDWWVAFGGYDKAVHFLDPATGEERMAPFATDDIIKGTVTADPDGFPLLYTGSRDNYFHIVALDRAEPTELWRLGAQDHQPTLWNDDWDSSALVIDDHLLVGGENGRFYVIDLNRSFGADGLVQVHPEVVFTTESWDAELLADIGDSNVSVESSVALSGNTVYFGNSAGLIQGWSLAGMADGAEPERVFRYWVGDDTDASVVVDDEGMLYIGSEYQRGTERARALGQIIKLDPSNPDDPVVWSVLANESLGSGIWATPALYGDLVIVATDGGAVLGLDRATGAERWRLDLAGPLWSSPVVVDDTLIQADCAGELHAFDLSASGGGAAPVELWSLSLGGCLESTPAVWDGRIFIGSRLGRFYAIG